MAILTQQHSSPQCRRDGVEHVVDGSLHREPGAGIEFHLELACSPSGVSREDTHLLDSADAGGIQGDVDESDIGGRGPPGLLGLNPWAMSHADRSLRLNGPSLEDPCRWSEAVAPCGQMVPDFQFEGTVEDDTHRSIAVVVHEENDAAKEIGIGKNRGSHEQHAGSEICHAGRLAGSVGECGPRE